MATLISGSTGVNKITDGTIVNADIASGAAIAGTKLVMPTGSVIQVVSVANGSQQSSTSGSWVAHSGLTAAITPSSTSNKILVSIAFSYRTANGTNNFNATIYRGSTNILHTTKGTGTLFSGSSYYQGHQTIQFLDSPSTTSATTYQLYYAGSTTTTINTDSGIGTVTLQEIAG